MRSRQTLPFAFLLLAVSIALTSCGGGGSSSSSVNAVSVAVFPTSVSLSAGSTFSFIATVTGSTNHAVTWQVNGVAGGSATVGTIGTDGSYVAPQLAPAPATVTVTAISQADTSQSGKSAVTITAGIQVAPVASVLNIGGASQLFAATVTGISDTSVDWSVGGVPGGNSTMGTVTAGGLYTSPNAIPDPADVSITATLQSDSTQTASASCTLNAGGAGPNQQGQGFPIKLGSSGGNKNNISSQFCCSGTLGALVSRGGKQFILSNNHVLADTDAGKVGDVITQPGLVDNNCDPGAGVATLTQWTTLKNPGGTAVADAALAQVTSGAVDPAGAILQLGSVSGGTADAAPPASTTEDPVIGMTVAKSGRTTGLECSTITSTNVSVSVQYEDTCGSTTGPVVTYSNQVEIDSTTFSDAGDSGSLIVDSQTAEPVALLFAGGSGATIGNPINTVLQNLADTKTGEVPVFVGGAIHPVSACTGTQGQEGILPSTLRSSPISDAEMQRVISVKEAHVAAMMRDPAVVGVGVTSGDLPGEAAIIVWVDKTKTHPLIPATIDGVRTKVRSVERFRARTAGHCSVR